MKGNSYAGEFKAKVAVEAIKGTRTINELAAEFGVHASQTAQWKKRLLEAAPAVFSRGNDHEAQRLEAERQRLFGKVGQLQIKVPG